MPNDRAPYSDSRIVAVGLLTRREVTMFGTQLARLYPLEDDNRFADLIEAIDEADRAHHQAENSSAD